MNKFNLVGGILMIILCIALFPRKKAENEVASSGKLVNVEIVKKPKNCDVSARFRYMHFRYNGHEHSIAIGPELCQRIQVGKTTQLKYSDMYPDVFMIPGKSTSTENISWAGLFLLSCYCSISSFIKLRNNKHSSLPLAPVA